MPKKRNDSRFTPDPWTYGRIDTHIETKNVSTVNLKEFYEPQLLYIKIDDCVKMIQRGNVKAIVLIHGYGSNNTPALIHDRTRAYLRRKYGKMRIVNGEDFNIFNEDARALHTLYPELDVYLKVCNHGVTIIGGR